MRTIHISREGETLGEFTESEVLDGLRGGQLSRTDWAWYEGLEDWVPLETLEDSLEFDVMPPVAEVEVIEPLAEVTVVEEEKRPAKTGWLVLAIAVVCVIGLAVGAQMMGFVNWRNISSERAMPAPMPVAEVAITPVPEPAPTASATPVAVLPSPTPVDEETASLWRGAEDGMWEWYDREGLKFRTPVTLQPQVVTMTESQREILRQRVTRWENYQGQGDGLSIGCTIFHCEPGTEIDTGAVLRDTMDTIKTAMQSQASAYEIEDVSLGGQEIRGVDVIVDSEGAGVGVKAIGIRAGNKVAVIVVTYLPNQKSTLMRANRVLSSLSFTP